MPSSSSLASSLAEFLRSSGGKLHPANREQLNFIADEFSGLNFKKISSEECLVLLKSLTRAMSLVPPKDSTLAAKICHSFANVAQPHSARVFSADPQQTLLAEDWILRVFQIGSEMSILQSMSALEIILRGRSVTVNPEMLTALISENEPTSLTNWLKESKLEKLKVLSAEEVRLGTLRVVKAIASPTEPGITVLGNACPPARVRKLESCTSIFKQQLSTNIPTNNTFYLKTTATCLRGLQAVLFQRPSALGFIDGFGLVQAFWLVGLPEHDASKFPPVAAEPGPPPPTAHSASKHGAKKGQGRANTKQVRRMKTALVKESEEDSGGTGTPRSTQPQNYLDETLSQWAQASDSEEFSDSGNGQARGSREIASAAASVRFASVRLLLLLIRQSEPQILMSFWDSLVPYSPPGVPPPSKPGLPCCLLRDPSISSKVAAAQCFGDILLRCQMYFSMAEASSGQMAFTPWSHTMAQSLESCQRYLLLSLSSDRVPQCLASTLNALNLLVAVTPYHRLLPGLITRLSRSVRPFLINKHIDVKSSALSVFTSLVSSSAATHNLVELQKILQRPEPSSLFESVENSSANLTSEDERQEVCGLSNDDLEFAEDDISGVGKTWLIEYCLTYFQKFDVGLRLKLEICRTLAAVSQSNFELLLSDNGSTLLISSNLLIQAAIEQDADIKLQLAAGRAIVSLGTSMAKYLEDPDHSFNLNDGLNMWNNIIKNSVSNLSTDPSPVVRSLVCDVLSSIGPLIYENLERSSRLVVAFTLFALCRDQTVSVKIQAVRALGMCASWPIEMEEGQFLLDAADYVSNAISNETDEGLKAKVTWALGNVSDELVSNKEKGFPETLPENLLIKLIKDSLHFCQDEKVFFNFIPKVTKFLFQLKMNAVRSLGNLVRLLSQEQLRQPSTRELIFQAVTAITNCATSKTNTLMKAKWNACYALACMLRGDELNKEVPNWQAGIFPVLCDIVISNPNFKVRLSAAVALAAPSSRQNYFSFYSMAWKSLLEALSSADNIQDFKEFQHRDNLVNQICLSICHLASLLTVEDLSGGLNGSLMQLVMAYEENFVSQLQRARSSLLPEKSQLLSKAAGHLKELTAKQSGPALIACDHLAKMLNAGQLDNDLLL